MAAASERGLITVADGKYRVGNRTGQLGLVGVWPGTLVAIAGVFGRRLAFVMLPPREHS